MQTTQQQNIKITPSEISMLNLLDVMADNLDTDVTDRLKGLTALVCSFIEHTTEIGTHTNGYQVSTVIYDISEVIEKNIEKYNTTLKKSVLNKVREIENSKGLEDDK